MRGLTHTCSRVKAMAVATLAFMGMTWIPASTLQSEGMCYRALVYLGEESQDPSSKFHSLP